MYRIKKVKQNKQTNKNNTILTLHIIKLKVK